MMKNYCHQCTFYLTRFSYSCSIPSQNMKGVQHMDHTKTILLQCATRLLSLASINSKCSEQDKSFYHRQMIKKMAQTQKHCASFLIDVANELPSIHQALQDGQPYPAYPIQRTRSRTSIHRRRHGLRTRTSQAKDRRYTISSSHEFHGQGLLRRPRRSFCKNIS